MADVPERLVIQPYTVLADDEERLIVRGVVVDRLYQLTPDFRFFLEYFERGAERDTFLAEFEESCDREVLEEGLEHLCAVGLLVSAEHAELMRSVQLVPPVAPPFGFEKGDLIEYLQADEAADIVVMGFPFDGATTGGAGARNGPEALRYCAPVRPVNSGRIVDLASGEVFAVDLGAALDLGDLRARPGEAVESYGARIEAVAAAVASRGSLLIALGGDHSITYPLLRGLARGLEQRGAPGAPGLLHFDAHTDLPLAKDFHQLMGRHTHGTCIRNVLDDGLVSSLLQVGLRGLFPEREAAPQVELGIPRVIIGAHQAAACSRAALLEHIPEGRPYYLTVDIDVLDPAFAPDTGTPSPGGLSAQRLTELLGWIAESRELVGIDVTEVAGSPARTNRTAAAAAHALEHCLLRARARCG